MFRWLFGNSKRNNDEEIKKGFSVVKHDIEVVGKWIKHLDWRDKQLFDAVSEIEQDLSTIKEEVRELQERAERLSSGVGEQQLFEKTAVYDKQTAVEGVGNAVQTAVQTGSFYNIFKNLSANERVVLFTVMNSDMKLSYEDLALLLGKERSTVRGQVNAIKQKCEGLIQEMTEKNGKKRVFVPEEIKEKLAKYAKVRVMKGKKVRTIQHQEVSL